MNVVLSLIVTRNQREKLWESHDNDSLEIKYSEETPMLHLHPLSQSPLKMDGVLLRCQMGHIYPNLSAYTDFRRSLPVTNHHPNSKQLNYFPYVRWNILPYSTISILLNTVSIFSSVITILYVRAASPIPRATTISSQIFIAMLYTLWIPAPFTWCASQISLKVKLHEFLQILSHSWPRFEMDGIILPCIMECISLRQALVSWSSSHLTFYTF